MLSKWAIRFPLAAGLLDLLASRGFVVCQLGASFKLALRDCMTLVENYGDRNWGFANPIDPIQTFFCSIDNPVGFAVRK